MDKLTGMMVFAKVVEAKSFSAAAQRLGISKSSVSKQVARLERTLKARAVPELLARYPEMAVQIAMNDRPVDLAEEGFDVAIRLTYDPPPGVVARKLTTVSWLTCAG